MLLAELHAVQMKEKTNKELCSGVRAMALSSPDINSTGINLSSPPSNCLGSEKK